MKKNNKGFTMIELLAVVVIMGLLTTIAVPAVYKYVTRARGTSTDTMMKSTFEAAENYMMDHNMIIKKEKNSLEAAEPISIATLVEEQYLEPLIDPISNSNRCDTDTNSKVYVWRDPNFLDSTIPVYKYRVVIKCPESGELGKVEGDDTKTIENQTYPKE